MAVSEHQKRRAFLRFFDQHKLEHKRMILSFFCLFSEIPWRYLTTLNLKTARSKLAYSLKMKKSFFLDATFSTGGTSGIIVFFPQPEVLLPARQRGALAYVHCVHRPLVVA